MKKIVALVLSLVMVLGLAATAYAVDTTTVPLYDLHKANAASTEIAGDVNYVVTSAVKNEITSGGKLEYISFNGIKLDGVNVVNAHFVKIDAADATTEDYYVTAANDKTPLFYLSLFTDWSAIEYERTAVEFTNIGIGCKQLNVAYVDSVTNELVFYTYTNPVTKAVTYYVDKVTGVTLTTTAPYYAGNVDSLSATNILVDDEVVEVYEIVPATGKSLLNQHVWAPVTYDKTTPVTAQCGLCGAKANLYKDGKIPAGSLVDARFDLAGTYYNAVVVADAVDAPAADGEKVESAETFDAGIAMYVGMSVMAAAGSAVVLKKKD